MHPHKGVLSMSLFSFLLLFRHQYSSIHVMIIVIYRYIEVKIFFVLWKGRAATQACM